MAGSLGNIGHVAADGGLCNALGLGGGLDRAFVRALLTSTLLILDGPSRVASRLTRDRRLDHAEMLGAEAFPLVVAELFPQEVFIDLFQFAPCDRLLWRDLGGRRPGRMAADGPENRSALNAMASARPCAHDPAEPPSDTTEPGNVVVEQLDRPGARVLRLIH